MVISELGLERRGYRVTPADPNLWCPLADGGAATHPGGSVIALNGRIAALGVLDLTEPG